VGNRRWQFRGPIAVRGVHLGLDEEDAAAQVGVAQVGATRNSSCMGPAGGSVSASVRYQSSSCSCRMTGNTANIGPVMPGACRQSCPPNVTWATRCPAPKQS
jgi:hypothetical protein